MIMSGGIHSKIPAILLLFITAANIFMPAFGDPTINPSVLIAEACNVVTVTTLWPKCADVGYLYLPDESKGAGSTIGLDA